MSPIGVLDSTSKRSVVESKVKKGEINDPEIMTDDVLKLNT